MKQSDFNISDLIYRTLTGLASEQEQEEFGQLIKNDPELFRIVNEIKEEIVSDKDIKVENIYWEKFLERRANNNKKRIPSLLKIAAILIPLGLIIGTAWFFFSDTNKVNYTELLSTGKFEKGVLILEDGSEVPLNEDLSTVQYLSGRKELVVNRDTLLTLGKGTTNIYKKNNLNILVMPYGKRTSIVLSDGTKIWVNSGSQLIYPTEFTGKKREVFLEGEAFFDVEEDRKRPFIVTTATRSIEVYGTRFNVFAYKSDQNFETVLVEGSIALFEPDATWFDKPEVVLEPNQLYVLNKKTNRSYLKTVDVEYYTSWIDGKLLLDQMTMGRLAVTLQRLYNVNIIFSDKSIENYKITGKLNLYDNIDITMEVVGNTIPFYYKIEGNNITVIKK